MASPSAPSAPSLFDPFTLRGVTRRNRVGISPLVNLRDDRWGGSFEARVRFPLTVIEAVRQAVPDERSVWVRVSASDWRPDGWTVDDTVRFAELAREAGADLIDCSAGGAVPSAAAKHR